MRLALALRRGCWQWNGETGTVQFGSAFSIESLQFYSTPWTEREARFGHKPNEHVARRNFQARLVVFRNGTGLD